MIWAGSTLSRSHYQSSLFLYFAWSTFVLFSLAAPESYEELENVLANRTAEQKAVILERMIKCNHPSLLESNKEKLKNLFALLLQHLHDLASSTNPLVRTHLIHPKLHNYFSFSFFPLFLTTTETIVSSLLHESTTCHPKQVFTWSH